MTVYANVARGTFPGESWSFTLHTENAAGSLATALSTWHDAVSLMFDGSPSGTNALKTLIATDVSVTEVSTASLDPVTGKQVSRVSSALVWAGTNVGASLPPQCAVGGSLRTAKATRAGRGRFYLPPFSVDTVAFGRLDGTDQALVLAAIGHMLSHLQGAGYLPVIYHRSTKLTDDITTYDVGDVYDTQRRRRDKLIETRVSASL